MSVGDASVVKRLLRELSDIQASPVEGVRLALNEANVMDIPAEIDGPVCTPYDGGVFRLRLAIPADYPAVPPKGTFVTKIFHPNVHPTTGEICVNVLKKDWTPETGLRHVLMVIKCLLVHTNPESALNEEAGRLLLEDYHEFERTARLMTSIHAQRRSAGPLTASGGNAANSGLADGVGLGDKPSCGGVAPMAKKAKPDGLQPGAGKQGALPIAGSAASKVKKSLKRL